MDPDADLVRAMAEGQQQALAALYERHASVMLGLAMRIVRNRKEAEDLLHDVFLEAWRSAKTFDPKRGRVRTWLAIRMRSRALDQQKSSRISRNAGDGGLERLVAEDAPPSPDHAKVRSALEELPPEQRQVIELAYFEGLSCSEIAERIGAPIGTVKSRLSAAMSKLRATLGRGKEAA
ncbi:MAG: sigma-70 family RNA polymerase sigma factor [Kofleriaceae bacterium]